MTEAEALPLSILGSNVTDDPAKLILKLRNRTRWRHGFSQCEICQSKLMAYLDKGHTLADVIDLFGHRKPGIKNVRRYAMNAIRQSTGNGLFDNYIVDHKLWTPRNPVIAEGEEAAWLHKRQRLLAAKGRFLLETEKIEALWGGQSTFQYQEVDK